MLDYLSTCMEGELVRGDELGVSVLLQFVGIGCAGPLYIASFLEGWTSDLGGGDGVS